jgi:hypothetical protein
MLDISLSAAALGFSHGLGHEDQFPPRQPNARFAIGKVNFPGMHRNGRDAP